METILIKGVFVGDSGTSKTSIVNRYARDNSFTHAHIGTIGVDFAIKTLNFRDINVKFQLWDTAGHERFRTITNSYLTHTNFVIITYDITDRRSFKNVKRYLQNCRERQTSNYFSTFAIVGTKTDLESARKVSKSEGQELAEEEGCLFFEISCLKNEGIEFMMDSILEDVIYYRAFSNYGRNINLGMILDAENMMKEKWNIIENDDLIVI